MSTQAVVVSVNVSSGSVPKMPISRGRVTETGIDGDRQAKVKIHGGPTRALCLFPKEAIDRLREEGHPIEPGSVGENITTAGLDWAKVVPGARFRIGRDLIVEITSFASPCQTIAGAFSDRDYQRLNRRKGVSRVYGRVLTEGVVRPGDAISAL